MKAFKALILFGFIGAFSAAAEPFPVSGLEFNPKANVTVTNLKTSADHGFLLNATSGGLEIVIKGLPMKSADAAAEMAKVEMANIKNLYSPRGSPYAGQISDVIRCEKGFQPVGFTLKVMGKSVPALAGGTNGRKLFGTCTHDQTEFWGAYFTFFDGQGMREIDVRVFAKFSPGKMRELSDKVRKLSTTLFVDKAP